MKNPFASAIKLIQDSMKDINEQNIEGVRNKKEMVIGAKNNNLNIEKSVTAEKYNVNAGSYIDTSKDVFVARDVKYIEDGGQTLFNLVKRLESGQMVIVDFSDVTKEQKVRIFDVLYGAVLALHGGYVILDKNNDIIMFLSSENSVEDENKIARKNVGM